jgi:hypothetical protein
MTPHKYSVGQKVSFNPGGGGQAHLGGSYTVLRQLPSENREWQYRVKSDRDSHERIVAESQLTGASATSLTARTWPALPR